MKYVPLRRGETTSQASLVILHNSVKGLSEAPRRVVVVVVVLLLVALEVTNDDVLPTVPAGVPVIEIGGVNDSPCPRVRAKKRMAERHE